MLSVAGLLRSIHIQSILLQYTLALKKLEASSARSMSALVLSCTDIRKSSLLRHGSFAETLKGLGKLNLLL